MFDLREKATTLSYAMNLPAFLLEGRKLEPIHRGNLEPSLLSAFHFYLTETQGELPELKPPYKAQLLKHIDKNGLITLNIIDIQKDGIKGIIFGPIFEKDSDRKPLVDTLLSLPGKRFSLESAIAAASSIPEKDTLFSQAWGKVVMTYYQGENMRNHDIHTIRSAGNYFSEEDILSPGSKRMEESDVYAHYTFEHEISRLIAAGDKNKLKLTLLPKPGEEHNWRLLKSHSSSGQDSIARLRQNKNALIETNSLFRITAEDTGLSPLYSHAISEATLGAIEKASFPEELQHILETMIEEYCNALQNMSLGHHNRSIVKVQKYIIHHIEKKLRLEELSEIAGLEPSYLCRLFRKECHMTIGEYITMLRVNEAKWLLKSTEMSILDIALAVGIGDQSHFAQVFSKRTGLTPTQYRTIQSKE